MICAAVVPDTAVLRIARAPFFLAKVVDERVRDRGVRVRVCDRICVRNVRVDSNVAVPVFVASVGVPVVCIWTKTREGDEHHGYADANHQHCCKSAEYPPDRVRFFTSWWSSWPRRPLCGWWRRRCCWSRSRDLRLRTIDLGRWRLGSVSCRWVPDRCVWIGRVSG